MRLFVFIVIFCASIHSAHQENGNAATAPVCAQCNAAGQELKRCTGCKRAYFCNKKCQTDAWVNHQRICCNSSLIPFEDHGTCIFYDGNNLRNLTQKEFRALTNKTFVLASLFNNKLRMLAPSALATNVPSRELAFDSVALCDEGRERKLGVVAAREINEGEYLCCFGGEAYLDTDFNSRLQSPEAETCSIGMDNIMLDPSHYPSLGAFLNDGPPNCELKGAFIKKPNVSDTRLPCEKVAIATKKIPKGCFVYIDYSFDHPIKQARYSVDEGALSDLLQKFSTGLDFFKLNGVAQIMSAFGKGAQVDPNFLEITELQYILATPFIFTLFHLKLPLDPAKTLNTLQNLSFETKRFHNDQLKRVYPILKALIKINDKAGFSKIVHNISQQGLIILCHFIINQNSQLSIENLMALGLALDQLKLQFHGTGIGSLWHSTKQDEFRTLFLSQEYQRNLQDETCIKDLPPAYQEFYRQSKHEFQKTIGLNGSNNN